MHEALLFQALAVPTAVGFLCYLLGRGRRGAGFGVALVGAVWTLVAAYMLALRPEAGMNWPWFDIGGIGLGLVLRTTPLSALLGLCVAGFGLLVVLNSFGYLDGDEGGARYYAFVMWTLAGALTALYADHLLLLLVGWEVVTLMLFLLANVSPTEAAAKGGMKSFVMLGFGDCAMLAGMALLWGGGPMPNLLLSEVPQGGLALGVAVGHLPYLLLLAGALAKAGGMPLHTWVPDMAEGAKCSVMAFLPASLDKLLGIYLLALISLRVFAIDQAMQIVLLAVGMATVLGAVMMAMAQHNLKRLLAYHAVSQVGYMVLGIGTGVWIGVVGGLFHMLNNAIYKSCLFLGAGAVEKRTGTTELDELGGLGRRMPLTFAICAIAAFSISGVPPFNGFASKWMTYQGLLASDSPLASVALVAAVFGSALTLASFVKVLHSVFAGPPSERVAERNPREVGPLMWAPMLVLALLCVAFGLWYAFPADWLIAPAVEAMHPAALVRADVGGAWQPMFALALVVLGVLAGLIVYALSGGLRIRRSAPYMCGETLPSEPHRMGGSGFYTTVRELPGVKGAYADAERKAFDAYRIGGGLGGSLVQALRNMHTGVLPLYVSWCLVGLIVLMAFLVWAGL